MEADERPPKMRKLGHHTTQSVPDSVEVSPKKAGPENGINTTGTETQDSTGIMIGQLNGSYNSKVTADSDDVEAQEENDAGHGVEDSLPPPEQTAPLAASAEVIAEADPPLSKNQQKKLRKKQEWEAKRDERKVIRKEKLVAKRERKRTARNEVRAENGEGISQPLAPTPKSQSAPRPAQLPITFLIDCNFDDLMRDNERISLASQITRCYSDNKNSMFRAHLTVCSFGGKLRERFDTVLSHYKGWRGVRFLDCDFVEAAETAKKWMLDNDSDNKLAGALPDPDKLNEDDHARLQEQGEVVYLSSESDETLTELKPYSTYIIGGLVDKNREKGICYKRARQCGVRTARLPIGEFMEMQSRKVLATNHVNEIMLKWLECGDWGQAFLKVIPKRKGGKLKSSSSGQDGEIEADEHGDEEEQPQHVGRVSDVERDGPEDAGQAVGGVDRGEESAALRDVS